jgi:hypothetical protein
MERAAAGARGADVLKPLLMRADAPERGIANVRRIGLIRARSSQDREGRVRQSLSPVARPRMRHAGAIADLMVLCERVKGPRYAAAVWPGGAPSGRTGLFTFFCSMISCTRSSIS